MSEPQLPPLLRADRLHGRTAPLERACAMAVAGTEAGIVPFNISDEALRAAILFAPEVCLEDAMAMLPACGLGFQNALGSLAPPEVAVHLEWTGEIRVNGARCGMLTVAASNTDAEEEPDWLAVGLDVTLSYPQDSPGDNPHYTALMEEGCAEVDPTLLLEAWARHTLYWINRWLDEGVAPLHAEWRSLAYNIGEEVELQGISGVFLGIDERFGALVRSGEETTLIPLSKLLVNQT